MAFPYNYVNYEEEINLFEPFSAVLPIARKLKEVHNQYNALIEFWSDLSLEQRMG